jgi:hypothetical protein
MSHKDFQNIPASACAFAGGEFEMQEAGDEAKTAKVRIKARSGQPIEHWFWGRVVHDLAGMRLHKNRLPIDYAHNDAEVLGYLNHFETESGNLVCSGALTPFGDTDRASEVIHKAKAGVPYEASIFFGGDGIKLQEVAENELAQVNGYQFNGPGVIVREWPLRAVAICPYGADANTESAFSRTSQTSFRASEWKPDAVMKPQPEGAVMEKEVTPAPATELKEAEQVSVETKTEEVAAEGAQTPVEAAPVEAAKVEEDAPDPVEESKAELKRMVDEFGADIALACHLSGKGYAEAQAEFVRRLKAENEELKQRVQASAAGGQPAAFAPTSSGKSKTLVDVCAAGTRKK